MGRYRYTRTSVVTGLSSNSVLFCDCCRNKVVHWLQCVCKLQRLAGMLMPRQCYICERAYSSNLFLVVRLRYVLRVLYSYVVSVECFHRGLVSFLRGPSWEPIPINNPLLCLQEGGLIPYLFFRRLESSLIHVKHSSHPLL